jgi:chromosome partitioning protein
LVRQNLKPDLAILGMVFTMYEEESELAKGVFDQVYREFPHKIFRTVVPRNVRLAEAPIYGRSIFEHSNDSTGARAYHRLAREIHMMKGKR